MATASDRVPTLALTLVLALASLAPATPALAGPPEVGDRAPTFVATGQDGERLRVPRDLDGPTVMVFWTTHCPYCKALMPELTRMIGRPEFSGVQLIALDFADEPEAVRETIEQRPDMPFRYLHVSWDTADDYDVFVVPGVFVVDEGRIRYTLDHPEEDLGIPELAAWWRTRIEAALRR